jgi:hypothetical protein
MLLESFITALGVILGKQVRYESPKTVDEALRIAAQLQEA